MEKPLLYWILGASVVDFALMGIDKHRAKRGRWRIREKTLFLVAFLGGTPGAMLGMRVFRHKTLHKRFAWGLPALLLLQLGLLWFGWEYGIALL